VKKPTRPPALRGQHLSDEDQALWAGTAETLEPLTRRKARVHPAVSDHTGERSKPARSRSPSHVTMRNAPATAAHGHGARQPEQRPAAPLAEFDRKIERKLGRGHKDVEARIDLHGLYQSEAHRALRRFILDCHAKGLRHVLVITGKGAPHRRRPDDEEPWGLNRKEPGVLRRSVPQWLAEPDLRAVIVSFTPAALRHGGDGALYVHLRSRDRQSR